MLETPVPAPSQAEPETRIVRRIRVTARISIGMPRATACLSFLAGYAALVYFFSYVDVYDNYFFDAGYSFLYNAARVIFIIYLLFLLISSGEIIAFAMNHNRENIFGKKDAEFFIVYFFAGAIFWQFVIMGLGYLSLYSRSMVVVATMPATLWASWRFYPIVSRIWQSCAARFANYTGPTRVAASVLLLGFFVAAGLLLISKAFYPAGGHDYYTHYFYYYTTSLKNHSIWPNDVWYHYFYSKGEGIFFLSMLLTDPLAPSLVTFCFIIVATVALFLFIERMTPGTLWPWSAGICWLLILICGMGQTGFTVDNSNDWAEFPKEHEINAAFVMAFTWLSSEILYRRDSDHRLFFRTALMVAFAVAYIEQPTPIFFGLFAVLVLIFLLIRTNLRQSVEFFALACAAGIGFVSNLVLNYVTTGIPSDVFINLFWPIVNVQKVRELGWLWPVIVHSLDLAGVGQSLSQLTFASFLQQLPGYLHAVILQAWFGYIQGITFALGAVVVFMLGRRRVPHSFRPALLLVSSLSLSFAVCAVLGSSAPFSFYRYSSFFLPIEFAAGAMLWLLVGALTRPGWGRWLVNVAMPLIAIAFFCQQYWKLDQNNLKPIVTGGARFVSGQYSIYDGYVDQSNWPSRMPFGAVYPGSLAAWRELGRDVRVWTIHIHAYCLLPGCRWESDKSFPGSPRMLDVLFGPADQIRSILQTEGLNYFLIGLDLEDRDATTGRSFLSPDRIADYLGVKWTDGTTYILTWLGPGVTPLTPAWLANYRAMVAKSPEARELQANFDTYRAVWEQLKNDPKWGYQLHLPWLR